MTMAGLNCAVIGGSSGIGLAIAKEVLLAGGSVTIGARKAERLTVARAGLGQPDRILARVVDMNSPASLAAFLAPFDEGALDALVITASEVAHGSFADTDPEAVAMMVASKVLGPYRAARAALPKMAKGGSITFCSGVLTRRPGRNAAGLSAANAAVEGLGRALALELGPDVRVNVLSPGMTRTDAYAEMPAAAREAMFDRVASRLPLRRVGDAQDIAKAAMLLMTNPFLTGHVLDVDGGHLIQGA
jgi:NAD(P)-dependent dehydrogenase (short-subunit alcohol dehydrogenase family)